MANSRCTPPKSVDIVTALKILSRYSSTKPNSHFVIELHGVCLKGADLRSIANFDNWNLSQADLRGANLDGGSAIGADFRGANLSAASLNGADLTKSDFRGAKLEDTKITWAKMDDTDIRATDFGKIQKPSNLAWRTAKGDANTTLPPGNKKPENW